MFFDLLDKAYRNIWVPLFGRLLFSIVNLIEGSNSIDKKPTYTINSLKSSYSSDNSIDKNGPPLQ